MRNPSKQQLAVLFAIREYVERHEFAPTCQEVGDQLRLPRQNIQTKISALVDMGYLRREARVPRGLVVTAKGQRA